MGNQFQALKSLTEYVSSRFGRPLKPQSYLKPSEFFRRLKKNRIAQPSGKTYINRFVQDDSYNKTYFDFFNSKDSSKYPILRFISYYFEGESTSNADYSNIELIKQVEKDFVYHQFEEYSDSNMQNLHAVFLSTLAFSLFFEECYVFETDFSHSRHIIPKYKFQTKDSKISKVDWPDGHEFSLFAKRDLKPFTFGFARNLSEIIRFQTKLVSLSDISKRSKIPTQELYYWYGSNDSYSLIYLFPFKYRIHRDSINAKSSERVFRAIYNCLNIKASNIIYNNQIKGRLRHTVAVQFKRISDAFNVVWQHKHLIVDPPEKSLEQVNASLSSIFLAKEKMLAEMGRQFRNEYDQFGFRINLSEEMKTPTRMHSRDIELMIVSISNTLHITNEKHLIRVKVDEGLTAVVKDTEALRSALTEIMFNATKYNVLNGRIRVVARREGQEVQIQVSNIGPALGELEREKIPSMGLRGLNAIRKSDQGSGQGLASMFELLESIDIEPHYRVYDLAPEQRERLRTWRREGDYPLSNHVVELLLEGG